MFEQWIVLFEATDRDRNNRERLKKFLSSVQAVLTPHIGSKVGATLVRESLSERVYNGRQVELWRLELRYYGLWPSGAASNSSEYGFNILSE